VADEVLEVSRIGKSNPSASTLMKRKPRDEVGWFRRRKSATFLPSTRTVNALPCSQPAHPLVEAPVAIPRLAVLELVEPVRAHRREVEGHDVGLVRDSGRRCAGARGTRMGWARARGPRPTARRPARWGSSCRRRGRRCRSRRHRARRNRRSWPTVAWTWRGAIRVGAGVQPARDLYPTLVGKVVRLDHEPEGLRFRLEAQQVEKLLGFQLACPRPGRTQ